MAYARAFSNSVVLPNGEVLVVGGQQHPQTFTDTGAVAQPRTLEPDNRQIHHHGAGGSSRAPITASRFLLPDGRVFSGGGGLCGDGCTTNHPDGQIFSPPYLFNANGTLRQRPVIKTAPAKAKTGSTITVTTNSATPKFALIRMSAVTHSVNNDQRLIPLAPDARARHHLYAAAACQHGRPASRQLHALRANTRGTPSVAKIINIR